MQNKLCLFKGVLLTKVPQELKETDVTGQVVLGDPPKHLKKRFQQGKEALRAVLMYGAANIFLFRMIDEVVNVSLQRLIASGRVRIDMAALLHCQVCGFLHRYGGKILDRLDNRATRSTDQNDNRRSIFVVMTAARFPFLSPTAGRTP